METLEQLKEIYDNKPEDATHHYFIFAGPYKISNFINANTQQYWDGVLSRWVEWGGCFDDSMRLLSDIKLIIELMEESKEVEKRTLIYISRLIEPDDSITNFAILKTISEIQNAIDKIIGDL